MLLPGRQRRRDRKPDHRAARTEHQWHPGHPLAVERQQPGPEPHHRRVRTLGGPRNRRQRRSRQGFARPALPAARLRPPDRDQGRRRRLADSDGHDPERQAVAARIERDRRPDGQGAVADHQRRERRADLGRKTLLDAPVARPREDGRLRHHPDRHQDGPRPRERRTAFGQHRGQHHGADDPHDGTDAHHAGVQRPGGARRRRPHHPHERRGTRRTGSAGHAQLHENERHSDGGRRRDPPAGRQPHRDRRCRVRTHGEHEEGPPGRRGHLLRIRQHALHPRLDRRGEDHRLRGFHPGHHHHLPLPAQLARDADPLHRDPRVADRHVLRDVCRGILDQRAVDAGRGALGGTGRRRRHRDDRKHLHSHRTGHDALRRRHRRGQGDLLRRNFDLDHADRRLLPDRLHGGHDGPPVPRIQHGDLGRGGHLDLRRADDHPDARDQAARAAGEEELVTARPSRSSSGSTTFTAARWPRSCAAGGWPCRWSC